MNGGSTLNGEEKIWQGLKNKTKFKYKNLILKMASCKTIIWNRLVFFKTS